MKRKDRAWIPSLQLKDLHFGIREFMHKDLKSGDKQNNRKNLTLMLESESGVMDRCMDLQRQGRRFELGLESKNFSNSK